VPRLLFVCIETVRAGVKGTMLLLVVNEESMTPGTGGSLAPPCGGKQWGRGLAVSKGGWSS